jgi:hypothetical protein
MMKIFLTASIACLYACSDFDELNSNPVTSTDMDPNLLVSGIQHRISENHQEWKRYLNYPGGFMNQWSGSWDIAEYAGKGIKQVLYMEQMWSSYYSKMVKSAVDIIQRTKDDPERVNIYSVGRILRVQLFLKLTDFYGDIPYSDAGMAYYNGVFKVKYDKQEDIYHDFFKELKEASDALDATKDKVTYDLYYNGDIAKWKRFANSLRLRIALRLIKVEPERAKEEAEAAIRDGVFTSNDDICFVKHEDYENPSTGFGKGNGLALRLSSIDEPTTYSTYMLSTELLTEMEKTNDPRIRFYGSVYANDAAYTDVTDLVLAYYNGSYAKLGVPAQLFVWETVIPGISYNNITVTQPDGVKITLRSNEQRMRPSKLFTAFGAPFVHMSYAEVKFLLAECAVRGWETGGTAEAHFSGALEAAVNQWTIFGASPNKDVVQAFVEANPLTGDEQERLLQINTQLWILHFLDPMETWSNWRRTGMPDLKYYNYYPELNQSGGKTPRRMQYPLEEQLKNKDFLDEAIARMGGTDDWTNRVWWDVEQ